MKPIGVVKKVDELGRLVIPSLIRDSFHMEVGDLWACSYKRSYLLLEPAEEKSINSRTIDRLGRLLIPHQIRQEYLLEPGDYVEFFEVEGKIALKKITKTSCQVTGETGVPVYYLADNKIQVSEKGLDILYQDVKTLLNK